MEFNQLITSPKSAIILLLLFLSNSAFLVSSDEVETYIVHVLPKANSIFTSALERIGWYESLLPNKSRLVYSYNKIISGFAAKLSSDELSALMLVDGFVQAVPDRTLALQTTRSPEFLGLRPNARGLWQDSGLGKGVIIGVLDSGFAAGHPSFSDNGLLSPPPSKWKGSCEYNASDCNNKLIGAKTFLSGKRDLPPYDENGHGTHTASTAGGMFVDGANVDGQANGTAAGIAPYAHLAVYKVCDASGGCLSSDILAGLDSAVQDGVDVVSISLGSRNASVSSPFHEDLIAIGAFKAIEQGVFVSCSAGNSGPSPATLSNEAPWILTVGASSIDRSVEGRLHLGKGLVLTGETLYQPADFPTSTQYPLVYPGKIGDSNATYCASLDGINVTGMVVVCDDGLISGVEKGRIVKNAGGVAMIIANLMVKGYTISISEAHVLPALSMSYADGLQVKSYIDSEFPATAAIAFNGTILGTTPAPVVTYFSSRGPNKQVDILKPDIIGPGLNILAAWPFQVGEPTASSTFNVESGTSMSAPHLSGVAALLKRLHPDWSPAAIKSAIMTSADIVGNNGNLIRDHTLDTADLFTIGAGHVNPSKAANPGFVYDIAPENYLAYLCAMQYADAEVSVIAGKRIKCSDYLSQYGEELNYPSFMVILNAANNYTALVSRNVTNVGKSKSSYTAQITSPAGVSMSVNPKLLSFTQADQVLQYTVTFSSNSSSARTSASTQGRLQWISSEDATTVRSPVVVVLS